MEYSTAFEVCVLGTRPNVFLFLALSIFPKTAKTQKDIQILNDYLGSDDWKTDFAADEAGLLSADLKRGVLSEDGIWNLLEDWRNLEERNEIVIDHAVMNATPLLPLPLWFPMRYYQTLYVWTCYHWTGFWRWLFHSHYFDVLLDEVRKVYPSGKTRRKWRGG